MQMDRCRFKSLLSHSYQTNICRCIAGDIQMQVEIVFFKKTPRSAYTQVQSGRRKDAGGDQFIKDNYNFVFSTFSRRAPGQHGLMSTKRSPLARHVDRHNRHTLRSNCNVGLCWANPFPRNASQKTVILHMLAEPFCAICMSRRQKSKMPIGKSSSCKCIPL